jgi:nucleoside-diphosphate-sugar epimerase
MKKIVITGGLGYLGTELCRLYSGISWKYKVLVVDNRFLSERLHQLRNWGIDFIIEDNNLKHEKFLPGVKIPIKNKKYLKKKLIIY